MNRIFLTSDLHFNHDREFVYKDRGFPSVEIMNEAIINRWNSMIGPDDTVYVLGDVMLGDNDKGLECLKRLKGTIHIILGNHDTATRVELYKSLPNVAEVVYATIIKYKKASFYLSHYPTVTANPAAIESGAWYTNLFNLHGHTHQKTNFTNNNLLMYHVGVDSHACFPVLLDDIIEEIKDFKQKILFDKK